MFRGCFNTDSGKFQGCFKKVLRMFQVRLKNVLSISRSFKGVSRVFESIFKGDFKGI